MVCSHIFLCLWSKAYVFYSFRLETPSKKRKKKIIGWSGAGSGRKKKHRRDGDDRADGALQSAAACSFVWMFETFWIVVVVELLFSEAQPHLVVKTVWHITTIRLPIPVVTWSFVMKRIVRAWHPGMDSKPFYVLLYCPRKCSSLAWHWSNSCTWTSWLWDTQWRHKPTRRCLAIRLWKNGKRMIATRSQTWSSD